VYARPPSPIAQDEYFAGAAKAAFDTLTRGDVDPGAALAALARAAEERRILVWSAHPSEQELIAGTVLEGSMPERDGDRPTIGVFLNDGTGAKLSYYLTGSATVTPGACRADGRRELRLTVALRSTAPSRGLSPSVVGSLGIVAPYTVRTIVQIVSPTGGSIDSVRRDGKIVAIGAGRERGRLVAMVLVDLKPGRSATLDVGLLTGSSPAGASGAFLPDLWTTPVVSPWTNRTVRAQFCQSLR
jgi:hypothetical protein